MEITVGGERGGGKEQYSFFGASFWEVRNP